MRGREAHRVTRRGEDVAELLKLINEQRYVDPERILYIVVTPGAWLCEWVEFSP